MKAEYNEAVLGQERLEKLQECTGSGEAYSFDWVQRDSEEDIVAYRPMETCVDEEPTAKQGPYDDDGNAEHYTKGGIETIDYLEAVSSEEQFIGFLRLNALKYLTRFDDKDTRELNVRKARWFNDRLLRKLREEGGN